MRVHEGCRRARRDCGDFAFRTLALRGKRAPSQLWTDRRLVDKIAVSVEPCAAGRARKNGVGILLAVLLSLLNVYDLAARGAADASFCHGSVFSASHPRVTRGAQSTLDA